MKKSVNALDQSSIDCAILALTIEDQKLITGGDSIAYGLGYTFGYAAGFFLAAGPRLIGQAAAIARFII